MSLIPDTDFDIIIAGGGMVGASLACALSGRGLRLAVIDGLVFDSGNIPPRKTQPSFDARVSAIAPASRDFFRELDVWHDMEAIRVSPYQGMHVWDADGTGSISFNSADIQQPELGFIIENSVILAALHRRLEAVPDVTLIAPAMVERIDRHFSRRDPLAARTSVHCATGDSFRAALLVASDGPNSRIRQLAGFRTREWDYRHQAIVTTVRTELPHGATALQRFMTSGPLAFLPLTAPQGSDGHYCSIVWSILPEQAAELLALDDEAFAMRLRTAIENRLGAIQWVAPRSGFPLRQRHAVNYVMDNIVLVGDAAHTIHPLAGQGVNLGLQDARTLAREIHANLRNRRAVNDPLMLQRYQRRRVGRNLSMMWMMEGFKFLFAQQSLPYRWARNAGLSSVDNLPVLKNRLIRQAAGY